MERLDILAMKIYYLMGKSASGKDTLYKLLLNRLPQLKKVVIHTTRPKRDGEQNGVEYYFDSPEQLEALRQQRKIIEERTYETFLGSWSYYTVYDQQFDQEGNFLMIGTLESYEKLLKFFGQERMVPIFIDVDNGIRLERAVRRERQQKYPNYSEVCRRFLSDEEDFSEEKLQALGITRKFVNQEITQCLDEICKLVTGEMSITHCLG